MSIANPEVNTLDQSLVDTFQSADTPETAASGMSASLKLFGEELKQQIKADFTAFHEGTADQRIKAARGLRQLTTKEKKFYEGFAEAVRADSLKQAITNGDLIMPETIITDVFEGSENDHPLLNAVTFMPFAHSTKYRYSTTGVQMAEWGDKCATITKELEAGFNEIDFGIFKLSAFFPICNAMLDLGPEWLDRFVRTMLRESIYEGWEKAIIDGSGVDEPIGMTRNIDGALDPTTGKPKKAAAKIPDLGVDTFAAILADLVEYPNQQGRYRTIPNLTMIVNPVDYVSKIFPATTLQTLGGYINNVLPYPTQIIQSGQMEPGKAVIGIAKRYLAGTGATTSRDGKIEVSEHYRWLEDEAVYRVKVYGNGIPMDNSAFKVFNISEVKPTYPTIQNIDITPPAP